MGNLVSIIVPVYNVEAYIKECVDSILMQPYTDYELILIDDGSPDNCGRICDEYKNKDRRVRVIHKENGGLSDARNAGIEAAAGTYITFIDSDDVISRNYLDSLVRAAIDNDADIVQGKMSRNIRLLGEKKGSQPIIYSGQKAFTQLLTWGNVEVYAWGKLYRRLLFEGIRYPFGRINEDSFTTYKLLLNSKTVMCIPNVIYYYRTNPESILNRKFYMKRFELWNVPEEIAEYIGESQRKYFNELQYYQMRIGLNLLNESSHNTGDPQIVDFQLKIINYLQKININNPYIDKKYKVMLLGLKCNPKLYMSIIRKYRKV